MVWRLNTGSFREIRVDGRRVLFHVPSAGLFELDDLGGAVFDQFCRHGERATEQLVDALSPGFAGDQVQEVLAELGAINLLQASGQTSARRPPPPVPAGALSTLVLNVTTGCNLACNYCYKADLARPAEAVQLSTRDGRLAIDMLIAESGNRRRLNITFFGGEPLTALPLIGELIAYADQQAGLAGKEVDYSLTTNALLLSDDVIDFLARHRFGITVSMDGPQTVHDLNRRTRTGKGTYQAVAANARRLLERYRARPVGARVTLTSGVRDVPGIHRHLKHDIGFAEVGFAPVTAGTPAGFCLDEAETQGVFADFEALAVAWRDAAIEGRDIGFSNISQLLTVLHHGHSKLLPCGAGLNLLAVQADGGISLCHRFAGSGTGLFGHVSTGVDRGGIANFLDHAVKRAEDNCSTCHARSVCAGGCYHESYARHGDMAQPTHHYCDLMRRWLDIGIAIYVELMAKNPTFMSQRLEPRGSMT